jgi:UPF0716 protein FxsA
MLVVSLVGWSGAILIGLATSALGLVGLKRAGSEALSGLRRAASSGAGADSVLIEGSLTGLGSLLLLLPGFVSDLVGLALSAPSIRNWALSIARRRQARGGTRRAGTIDLDPGDWHPVGDRDRTRFPRSR